MIYLRKLLNISILILLVLFSFQTTRAQAPIKLRSTFSSGGSSKTFTSEGKQYYLQQSIGQSGITGLSRENNYQLRQGFIQPLKGSTRSTEPETLPATISPNPFTTHILVSFQREISETLYVTLYDLNGRIVYFRRHERTREIYMDVSSLVSGIYIIRINTSKTWFDSKMIKF